MRPAVVVAALILLPLAAEAQRPVRLAGAAVRPAAAAAARIPGGSYLPLYDRGEGRVRVAAFSLDRLPVTRGDFLAFVRADSTWRRDRVRLLFADERYLADWAAPLDAGRGDDLRRPVTHVSWFAAKAYCTWRGGRLPSTDEWEYAAAASATRRDASRDEAELQRLVALYARPRGDVPPAVGGTPANAYGVRDLHGLVWEWTRDFNSVLVSDDSRGTAARDTRLFCAGGVVGATNPRNFPAFLRYAFRAGLDARATIGALGFRCAGA